MKREDYLSWDEYFMGIALLAAMRSKDPSTQVGACIVNQDKRILSMGYNGMPRHCDDDVFQWARDNDPLNSKYLYVCHAELNAILNCAVGSVRDCTVYVTLFPCNECAKAIIQSGIKEIIYASDKYKDTDSVIASKKMLDKCGVKYRQFKSNNKEIILKENPKETQNELTKIMDDIEYLLNIL